MLLVAPPPFTVWTFLAVVVLAVPVMVKVAVTVVSFTAVTLVTATPVPDTATDVVPVK